MNLKNKYKGKYKYEYMYLDWYLQIRIQIWIFVTPWYDRALYGESMTGPCTVTVWKGPALWPVTVWQGPVLWHNGWAMFCDSMGGPCTKCNSVAGPCFVASDSVAGSCFVTQWLVHVLRHYGRALYCNSVAGPCFVAGDSVSGLSFVAVSRCRPSCHQSSSPLTVVQLPGGGSWGKVKTDQGGGGGSSFDL